MHRHWAVTLQEMSTFNINSISRPIANPLNEFYKSALGFVIYMIIVSFTTILVSSLLFWGTFKNTTCFLASLTLVDILMALTPEQM